MPVAPNPLLQASAVGTSSRTAANLADKSLQVASVGFDRVLAQHGQGVAATHDDKAQASKPKDRPEPAGGGKSQGKASDALADGGKNLPAADKAGEDDSTVRDASLVAGQVTDAQPGAQLIQAQAEAVSPMLAALQQAQADGEEAAAQASFDPDGDPLDDLPALRLALEQSAQAQGTTSAHARDNQPAVNTLANLLQLPDDEAAPGEGGDQAFGGLLDDGLKDLKSAASDTRVDDFADRLSALTQAVTAKTANAVPTANPLQQPLAMNQGAWSEGLVNRVMYLSSQNLKSADIQLEPAELGRLDIRVNVAADQTQVTFISGHVGVRDTLESQVQRLRELFAQQGLAQPDVNVADQSRGQQQQGQPDGSQLSGVAARRAASEPGQAGGSSDGAMPVERQVVVGSSAVDYYA